MRRGGPLPRYAPLQVRRPLVTRSRLRQVSGKRRAVEARRMDLKARLIAVRGERCEGCGRRPVLLDMHERQKRSRGGTFDPTNCLLLCRTVCHALTEAEPAAATALGWLVPSWEDPATVPVSVADGRTVLLTSDGSYEAVEAA